MRPISGSIVRFSFSPGEDCTMGRRDYDLYYFIIRFRLIAFPAVSYVASNYQLSADTMSVQQFHSLTSRTVQPLVNTSTSKFRKARSFPKFRKRSSLSSETHSPPRTLYFSVDSSTSTRSSVVSRSTTVDDAAIREERFKRCSCLSLPLAGMPSAVGQEDAARG